MIEAIKAEPKSLVKKIVAVTPEQLIETGQRLRQWAMDQAVSGDAVILEFTDSISLLWNPTKEYTRNGEKT